MTQNDRVTNYSTDAPASGRSPSAAALERALFEVRKVVVGQARPLERMFVCLLAGGHALMEGVPGLAKTLAVSSLARACGGSFNRIQFTPDLLPADITGTRIYRPSTERFDVELGPIFANVILADEINRAPAKVQSALLEVMAEHQVTIGGQSHSVPEPFMVMATQNPIESEGVYPLPEAQRDRFLMRIVVDYPSPGEEIEIIRRMGVNPPTAQPVITPHDLLVLQAAVRDVYVDPAIMDYVVRLVYATRRPAEYGFPELAGLIANGCSPRASLGLVAGARALALLRDQSYVTPQEVYDVAYEVMNHRLVLSYEALADGVESTQIVATILSRTFAPAIAPAQLAHARSLHVAGVNGNSGTASGGWAPVGS